MTDEIVTRLYRALVEELFRRDHPEDRPVKVSALYQDLVPYQDVRSTLDVELNADYEHALLRLLSGERDLLRLEPAEAREELRREVEAPYPFVGLFRKFSASDVWVKMPAERPARPAPVETPPPSARGGALPERAPVRLHADPEPEPSERMTHAGQPCMFCAEPLPAGRRVRFCPRCGGDQRLRPCPRCDAVLERGWQYCINCGHEVAP
jgi:hypothetical protein